MTSSASFSFREEALEWFFIYARKRYCLFQMKTDGAEKPWTDDLILQSYRFCNIFREDDKVTRWFKEHIREPYSDHPNIVFATIAFRLFNRPETAALLLGGREGAERNLFIDWDPKEATRRLKGVKPLVGAAYMCPSPIGYDKLTGLVRVLNGAWKQRGTLYEFAVSNGSMEQMTERLSMLDYMGKFRSYEVVCDLQYTSCLEAHDAMTWANPGPGAKRGLCRMIFGTAKAPLGAGLNVAAQIDCMSQLLYASQNPRRWSHIWPAWDMRTVEHTLCEFDKYERVRLGEGRPKQKYEGK